VSGSDELAELLAEIDSYPGGFDDDAELGGVAVPLELDGPGGTVLTFLSTVTTFGTAVDLTAAATDPSQLLVALLTDLNADLTITINLPPETQQMLGVEVRNSHITFQERLVDGIGYLNMDTLQTLMRGSGSSLKGWYGLDLANFLKSALQQCGDDSFKQTTFSIGHRGGGTLQFPEHTKESHEAGARMGAGVLECDVTFTRDGQLVCRHDQCDLHTTTNILVTGLAQKCSVPFSPAVFDAATGALTKAASALCCTSDLTLAEFKSLKGKMDAFNPAATTGADFQGGTPNYRICIRRAEPS